MFGIDHFVDQFVKGHNPVGVVSLYLRFPRVAAPASRQPWAGRHSPVGAAAVAEKRQELVRFIEGLWDKYRVTPSELRTNRVAVEARLENLLTELAYR
jgi:hypothetical protein